MWFLKSSKGDVYYLSPGKYSVGRKNCDLVFDNDQSISRTHAFIEVLHPQNNWDKPTVFPIVKLSDAGSKYGTTLLAGNDTVKMEKDMKQNLKDGDVIHFGLQWNKWRLSYEPLVVVVSALPKAEKQKVRSVVGELGGHVVVDWLPLATHLTMATVTMTIKAISALARAKPIVTPQYWLSYKTAVQSKTDLPKCEEYVPPIGETVLNKHEVSFLANSKRMSLFQAKTFYFFSEPQFRDHSCLVEAGGGVATLVKNVRQMKLFLQPDAIPMQLLSMNSQTLSLSQAPEWFSEVCDFLKSHGKRLIPASEIGLAVLHCSIEKYCNPDFNFSSMLLRNSEDSQPPAPERILATETQDDSGPSQLGIGERKVIPDSGSESKVGLSMSLDSNLNITKSQNSQELVRTSQQMTQANTQLSITSSQSQSQGPSATSINGKKRLRVIEDSDDEVEILSPRKIPVGPASRSHKPPVVTVEDSSDTEAMVSTSNVSNSRLNISTTSHRDDDSDDPDQLFADFKESDPKTNRSFAQQCQKSPDMDADDLFADFKDDIKPSVVTNRLQAPQAEDRILPHSLERSAAHSSEKSAAHSSERSAAHSYEKRMSRAPKRNLSTDDENDPPEKRFAKLDLSKQPDGANENNEEHITFMSTTQLKKEDEISNVKLSCNVTVVFKPLVISKHSNSTHAISEASLDSSGMVNYKKFRKVNPLTRSVLPRIIGGSDLQSYQSFAGNSSVKNVMDNESDSEGEDCPNSLFGKSDWKTNFRRKV